MMVVIVVFRKHSFSIITLLTTLQTSVKSQGRSKAIPQQAYVGGSVEHIPKYQPQLVSNLYGFLNQLVACERAFSTATMLRQIEANMQTSMKLTAVSGIGAVVKVVDSHSSLQMGFNSPQKLQFFHSLLKQGLITVVHAF